MPYIHPQKQIELARGRTPEEPGELNFAITQLVSQYLSLKGLRYEHVNAVVGALECAKLECYRRIAVPYEDAKIASNGDVYPPHLTHGG